MIVEKATDMDVARLHCRLSIPFPWEGLTAKKGKTVMGIGGVYVEDSGRVMAFLEIHPSLRKPLLYRYTITYLKQLKARGLDDIYVKCDTRFPKAEKFLERHGFKPTGEQEDGMELWLHS